MVTDFISLLCASVMSGEGGDMDVHACGLCDRFALLARWMGCLVEELLKHHELDTGEAFACATCGIVRGYARHGGCPGQGGGLHERERGQGRVFITQPLAASKRTRYASVT